MAADSEWFYVDRSGKEFGPFTNDKMRAWFSQGFFPIGADLLVRLHDWQQHAPVRELFPEGEPFRGAPRSLALAVIGGSPLAGQGPPGFPATPGYPGLEPHAGYGAVAGYPYGPPSGCYGHPHGFAPPLGPPGFPGAHAYGLPMMAPVPGYCFGPPPPPPPSYSRSRSPNRQGRRRGRGRKGGDDDEDGKRPFQPYHSTSVPKVTNLEAEFASGAGAPPTTAMLRNIPNKYLQDSLLEEIDCEGFSGTYDFFYLPMDTRNNANVGYAFINFLETRDLDRFCAHFDGYQFKKCTSQKIAAVAPATVQGLARNVQNLMKKRVAQGQYKPVVLQGGERVDFEQAAKELLV